MISFLHRIIKNKLLFWICVILISGWNMASIFILMISRFRTDSISIGVTTTYIQWTNTFPSVGICLSKNRITKEFSDYVVKKFPANESLSFTYIRTLYDYLFIYPNNIYIKEDYCKGLNSTCGVDILRMRFELLARNCSTIMYDVVYADKEFTDCDDIFKFQELDMGYCFLANNLIDYKTVEDLPLKYSSFQVSRQLKMRLRTGLLYRYDLYVNSPEDLPYFNAVSYSITSDPTVYSFNVEEIFNDHDVISENIYQRMCKFPNENDGDITLYSFSKCMSQIRSQMELENCNCTLYSVAESQNFCGISGISCLDKLDISGKVKEAVSSNLLCLPSCVEQQISFVGSRIQKFEQENSDYYVEIEIPTVPSARYYRTVTQSTLDLIVAVGGVIGLFIGASLLNILEVISMIVHKLKTIIIL